MQVRRTARRCDPVPEYEGQQHSGRHSVLQVPAVWSLVGKGDSTEGSVMANLANRMLRISGDLFRKRIIGQKIVEFTINELDYKFTVWLKLENGEHIAIESYSQMESSLLFYSSLVEATSIKRCGFVEGTPEVIRLIIKELPESVRIARIELVAEPAEGLLDGGLVRMKLRGGNLPEVPEAEKIPTVLPIIDTNRFDGSNFITGWQVAK